MHQTNQAELKLRYSEAIRIGRWHQQNVVARIERESATLAEVVSALKEPRGVAQGHAESFRDYVKAIIRSELAGAS